MFAGLWAVTAAAVFYPCAGNLAKENKITGSRGAAQIKIEPQRLNISKKMARRPVI